MSSTGPLLKRSSVLEAIKAPESPFPGLRPFEFDESHLFFGRDGQVEKMIARLAATHFLAVVGTSGSGKSSLVRAGLLPALRGGVMTGAGSKWRIALMRPGNDPIGNLARALNQRDVFGSGDPENEALQIAIAEATLRLGSRGLTETVRQNVMPSNENLLVVVDQFEELFRFAREARRANNYNFDNESAAFVKLLLEAVNPNESGLHESNIYVVLTMRSDFLGDCAQFWDLPEAINESQYLIPRLTRDQLREVITGPVALCGGEISPRLVNQLLNDIGDNQDQLPILQHALMRTWDEWKQPRHEHHSAPAVIDLCCYKEIGGMANALSKHADEAFDELPDDRHRLVAEKLFKSLTEKCEDNREIRRPVTMGEICAVAEAGEDEIKIVIETFRKPGRSFLMPPAGSSLHSETLIDISHESLIRVWKRLQHWVNEEAESATIYRRLVETAELHNQGRSELWRGADLQATLDWRKNNNPTEAWARRYDPDFETATAFLLASERMRADELAEIEQRRQDEIERMKRESVMVQELSRARLLRRGLLVLSALLVLLAGLAVYAFTKRGQAEKARAEAQAESTKADEQSKVAQEERDKAVEALKKTEAAQEAARQLAARELASTIQQLARDKKLDQLNAKLKAVKNVADNKFDFDASSVEDDTSGNGRNRLFRFEFYPSKSSLQQELDKIVRVSYILNHPSFINNLHVGVPSNNFKAGYRGWGCPCEVIAVIEYLDPYKAPSITVFKMCQKLGGIWEGACE
jgi:ABC-type Fe3+/spermidine/putrescine transport system ATPase subunit